MAKLQTLGMTEDQWYVKKREIKYMRERVRRAKLVAKRHAEELQRLPWTTRERVVKMGMIRRIDGLAVAPAAPELSLIHI